MDNHSNSYSYPYHFGYGYGYGYPHVSSPHPHPNSGGYPPPPPPHHFFNAPHSVPLPYQYPPSGPPPPAASHSTPLEYGYHQSPHPSLLPQPSHIGFLVPPMAVAPFQHQGGSQYCAAVHYHRQTSAPLSFSSSESYSDVPSRVNSFPGHHRQDSLASMEIGSFTNHDHANDNIHPYSPVFSPVDNLLANAHISGNPSSALASPPASAAVSASSSPLALHALSGMYDVQSRGPDDPPAHPFLSYSNSFIDSPHNQTLQIMPFSTSKGSLKVLPLHGNLDICVREAKNLSNMDMFHRTLGDMFNKLPGKLSNKIEGIVDHKITSDPYVSISVRSSVVGRTYVISNSENPVWMQRFYIPVAHYAAEVHFLVKDSDIVGSQLMGVVAIPVEQIYSGEKVQGIYPILNGNGKPCKPGAVLSLSIQYIPIERLSIYHHGVGAGPEHSGVRGTYFPLRKGGTVTLYQDAHVPDGSLPNLKLDYGMQYVQGKCWKDIFDAISQARRLIYIAGWSVWHRVEMVRGADYAPKCTLGDLLKSKSQEGVRVLLLIWDDPTSRSILGYKTEVGAIYTHHQKTIIVDVDSGNNKRRLVAFLGGLDLCDGRYDTPQHPLFRTLETMHVDDYYNPTFAGNVAGCPRQAWHDLHCRIDGPAAYDVLTNFEERWLKASKPHGLKKLKNSYDDALLRIERMHDIMGVHEAPWLSENDPEGWHVQIFSSIDSNSVRGFPKDPKDGINKNLVCGKNLLIDMGIHTAYVEAIRAAQHFIYIENQYFIGSSYNWNSNKDLGANNLIPMEIALKIADKIRAHERFSVYIVIPMWPEGNPTGAATQRILFWQHKTMQMMYETIYKALVEVGLEDAFTPQDYLNFFCLGNREAIGNGKRSGDFSSASNTPQGLSRKYSRFMIYVHSKGMIVDDEYVIVGSANINQRSLEGTRDTEIAMGAYQPYHTWARKLSNPYGQIYGYRMSLWAEHLGTIEDCFTRPESLECVRKVRSMGERNWEQFAADEVTEMNGHLLKYPVEVDRKGKVRPLPGHENFPDVGGRIVGSFLAIQENLTI